MSVSFYTEMARQGHLYKLTEEGQIVGGAILFLQGDALNIGRIFVAPEHFRKGYGSFMIRENGIDEFYITGADATGCVKSTCFNMTKAGYAVHVISDCVTSYDLKKMPEMLAYYSAKGCEVRTLEAYRKT